jgi:peptidyl-prolyl cis-trans isomerase C
VKARIEQITNQVIQEVLIRRHLQTMMTEDAIKARYQKFVAEQPAQIEVRASHILVATEEEANDIIKQLEGGADFAAIAKEKSTDPSAKQNGGDLGYFTATEMVPEFSQAVFALEKGESTKAPVKSQFGWHVIKVEGVRTKGFPPFEQIKEQAARYVSQKAESEAITQLHSAAKIEFFDADGKPLPPQAQATDPAKEAPADKPKTP